MSKVLTLRERVGETQNLLERYREVITKILPTQCPPERMMGLLRAMVVRRPELAKCKPIDLMGSVIDVVSMGLEPETPAGHAWIIPHGSEPVVYIGYKGYLQLLHQTGKVAQVHAEIVHKQDKFTPYPDEQRVEHRWGDGPRTQETAVGCYARATTVVSGQSFSNMEYMLRDKIMLHKAKSRAAKSSGSPWNDDLSWEPMWKKTVLKVLAQRLPQSTELVTASKLEVGVDTNTPQSFALSEAVVDIGGDDAADILDDRQLEDNKTVVAKAKTTVARAKRMTKPTEQEVVTEHEVVSASTTEPAPPASTPGPHDQIVIMMADTDESKSFDDAEEAIDTWTKKLWNVSFRDTAGAKLESVERSVKEGKVKF